MSLSQMWLLVCIAMLVIEVVTVGNLISVWFCIGAIASFAVSYVTSDLTIQVVVFVIVSLGSMILIRPLASKFLRGNTMPTNADTLIGRVLVLTEAIDEDKWGLIKVNGSSWSATTVDQTELPVGSRVEVVAIEGVKLIVRKVKEN